MNLHERTYILLSVMAPKQYKRHLSKQLVYAGEKASAENWAGSTTGAGILTALATVLIPYAFSQRFDVRFGLLALAMFFLIHLGSYLIVYFKIEDRKKRVETALPDFLQLIAANLRAGMTPFQALRTSARKEFGPLQEEIEFATAKALGTGSFTEVLLHISSRVKSDTLERAMKLFTTAMRSGGHLAQLLEELARDISESASLKKELVTNTKTYTMFILFTIVAGTPLLLAIAVHFLSVVTELQAQTDVSTASFGVSFLSGEIAITTSFLNKVSLALITFTGILASMLLGVISDGKMRSGLRIAPIIVIISVVVFIISKYFVGNFLGV